MNLPLELIYEEILVQFLFHVFCTFFELLYDAFLLQIDKFLYSILYKKLSLVRQLQLVVDLIYLVKKLKN